MEFGELFVNLEDDDTDTELLDFVPKKKVTLVRFNFWIECYF